MTSAQNRIFTFPSRLIFPCRESDLTCRFEDIGQIGLRHKIFQRLPAIVAFLELFNV
jgi:hypothetical protein